MARYNSLTALVVVGLAGTGLLADPGGPPAGPSSPPPGPTLSDNPRLATLRPKILADLIDHQEAALRAENTLLARSQLQPDATPASARNRRELIDNLAAVGRVRDAVRLARHLIDMPRRPGQDNSREGRRAVLSILTRYEGWNELAALEKGDMLEATTDANERVQRSLAFGLAHAGLGNADKAREHLSRLAELKRQTPDAEMAESRLRDQLFPPDSPPGEEPAAEASGFADRLARRIETLVRLGRKDDARRSFEELRRFAERADLDYPPFARLAPIARAFGFPDDWRIPNRPLGDETPRPSLANLGPLVYQPWSAPAWQLTDIEGKARGSDEFKQAPTLMIFYLGNGCIHCVQQLQAFRPLAAKFAELKVKIVAVGTDNPEAMRKSRDAGEPGEGLPFVMLSDAKHDAFRAFGAFDDFTRKPLHGLYLVDGSGRVRWQDAGLEPFTDAEFLLKETRRLLRSRDDQVGYREPPPVGTGLTPLNEAAASTKYKGQEGGLYGRDGKAPPMAHQKLLQDQSQLIQPLDREGKAGPLGRVVVLGLGGGPAADAFGRFKSRADRDPDTKREVVLVDGTQADLDSSAWADPKNRAPWTAVDRRLDAAGVTARQVQAIWLCACLASPGKSGPHPTHTTRLQEDLATIVTGLRDRFPNLRLVYLSSAAFGGYSRDAASGEPFAFETGLAVRGLIHEQTEGLARFNPDPSRGAVRAPVLAWGPYLWADGAKTRSGDGLAWQRDDFLGDGLRLSAAGRDKAGDALFRFFQEDAVASGWFCKVPK